MKVLTLNGNPHEKRCTYTTLAGAAKELNKARTEAEILHVDGDDIRGCMGYGVYIKPGRCIYNNNKVDEAVEKLKGSDGLVVGLPVHYAPAGDAIASSSDRFFHSDSTYAVHKPGAVVASARRAGITVTLDQLNRCFMISRMSVVSSQYWNTVHGSYLEGVKKGRGGMQIMRVPGHNMAWLL